MLRLALDHLRPWSEPVKFAGRLSPELLRLLDTAPVHRLILRKAFNMGLCGKLHRGSEHPVLPHRRIQILTTFNRCQAREPPILSPRRRRYPIQLTPATAPSTLK